MSFNKYVPSPGVGGRACGENVRPQGQPYCSSVEAGRVTTAVGHDDEAPQRQVSEGSFDFSPSATSRSSIADIPAADSSKNSRGRPTGPPNNWLNKDPWEEAAAGLRSRGLPLDMTSMANTGRSVGPTRSYRAPTDAAGAARLDILATQMLTKSHKHADEAYRGSGHSYRLVDHHDRERRELHRGAVKQNTLNRRRSDCSSGGRKDGGLPSYCPGENNLFAGAGADGSYRLGEPAVGERGAIEDVCPEMSGPYATGSTGGRRSSEEQRRAAVRRSDAAAFHAEMLDPFDGQRGTGSTQDGRNVHDAACRPEEECGSPCFREGRGSHFQAVTPRVLGKPFSSVQHPDAAAAAAEGQDVYVMAAENDEEAGLNPDLTEEAGGYWPPQFHGETGRSRVFGVGGGTEFAARPLGTSAFFPLNFMSASGLPASGEAAAALTAGGGGAHGDGGSEGDAAASEDSKGRAPSSGPASVSSSRLWTPPFATSGSWRDAVAAAEALAARRRQRAGAAAAGARSSNAGSGRNKRVRREYSGWRLWQRDALDDREQSAADGEEVSVCSTATEDSDLHRAWERPFLKRSCLDVSGGPLTRRSCTDLFFLLLLLCAWLAVSAAVLLHVLAGPSSLSRLTSGVDWKGRVCGHDPGVEDFGLLYWPAKQQPTQPLPNELPACSILPVCTKRCPQVFTPRRPAGECPADAEAAGLCNWYGGHGTALLLRSFCLFVDADGKAKDHGLLSSWVRWLGDLHLTWPLLLVAPAAALLCGYLFLWLLQKAAHWMIAAVVVAVEALLLLSAYAFYSGHEGFLPPLFLPSSVSLQSTENSSTSPFSSSSSVSSLLPSNASALSSTTHTHHVSSLSAAAASPSRFYFVSPFPYSSLSYPSELAFETSSASVAPLTATAAAASAATTSAAAAAAMLSSAATADGVVLSLEEVNSRAILNAVSRLGSLVLACCCGTGAVIVAVAVLIFRKELQLSTSLLTAAALLLRETPCKFLLLLPLAAAAALATHGALVVAALLHLLAVGWIPPLPLASCIPAASPWIRFPSLSWSSLLVLLSLLFVALWTAAFFNATCRMIISYYASAWYFMPRRIPDRKELLNGKASEAVRVVFRYHLGSAAFGGLILTSVQMLKFLLQWSKRRRIRRTQSLLVRILTRIGNCFASLYIPISCLSSTAYIFVALLGQPLLCAARTGIASVGRNPVVTAFVWQAGWLLQLCGKFAVALFVSWCCYAILPALPGMKSQLSSLVAPVTFTFVISFHVASACMQFFGFAADTLLQAFLADREMSLQDGKGAAEHAPASMRVLDRYLLRSCRNTHLSV